MGSKTKWEFAHFSYTCNLKVILCNALGFLDYIFSAICNTWHHDTLKTFWIRMLNLSINLFVTPKPN